MKTALIIEDNPNNMELMDCLMSANGFDTLRASTGGAGIALVAEQAVDFVLLDVQLPDMDGEEVVRTIREMPRVRTLPVIAVTSYAMSGDRERLLRAGCDGYIEKPIDPMNVVDQIQRLIGDAP